jgi:vacuolar-type H+-ATPase subunit I/STV1
MKPILAFALILAATTVNASQRDSYVLQVGSSRDTVTMSGSLEQFMAIRGTLDGDYLWVRRGGKTYVITDHARLAEVWGYFAPERELRPKQKEVEAETKKLEKESDALEDQDDRELTSAERSRLDDLREKERELSRREQALDDREEELDRIAEAKLWQLVDRSIRDGVARPAR